MKNTYNLFPHVQKSNKYDRSYLCSSRKHCAWDDRPAFRYDSANIILSSDLEKGPTKMHFHFSILTDAKHYISQGKSLN